MRYYVMNADGSGVVQLTDNIYADGGAAWSPDGSSIAFGSDRDGDDEIYVINVDGTGVIQLTDNSETDSAPSWSPEGDRIAFNSNRDGDWEIYVIDVGDAGMGGGAPTASPSTSQEKTQDLVQLTDNVDVDSVPSWSPDGSQFAFASDRGRGTGRSTLWGRMVPASFNLRITPLLTRHRHGRLTVARSHSLRTAMVTGRFTL